MTDADYYPTCPHPYGTEDYYQWWDLHHKLLIAEWNREQKFELAQQKAAEEITYGHNFHTPSGACWCGMDRREYQFVTNEERWRRRREFTCVHAHLNYPPPDPTAWTKELLK